MSQNNHLTLRDILGSDPDVTMGTLIDELCLQLSGVCEAASLPVPRQLTGQIMNGTPGWHAFVAFFAELVLEDWIVYVQSLAIWGYSEERAEDVIETRKALEQHASGLGAGFVQDTNYIRLVSRLLRAGMSSEELLDFNLTGTLKNRAFRLAAVKFVNRAVGALHRLTAEGAS